MSHATVSCVFCKAKLDPAKENQNMEGGWVALPHSYQPGCAIVERMCLRHHGIRKLVCQQNIPSMLSGIEGPDVPEEKLEAALVVMRSRKAYSEAH